VQLMDRAFRVNTGRQIRGDVLREHLSRRWNHSVVGRDDVPGRLHLPGGDGHLARKRRNAPRHLRCRHECRVGSRNVGGEGLGAALGVKQQEAVLGRKNGRSRCAGSRVREQLGDRLAGIGGKRGDVDQSGNLRIGTSLGDEDTTVRVAHEQYLAGPTRHHAVRKCHIVRQRQCQPEPSTKPPWTSTMLGEVGDAFMAYLSRLGAVKGAWQSRSGRSDGSDHVRRLALTIVAETSVRFSQR